ncbi:hypothetical protein JS562_17140 [Agrobacterium sp. S2]|nr:hypothetical protein [Agrobacterium sp. S2]
MSTYGGQLREYIESSSKRSNLLPLTHTTDVMAAQGIFQNLKIEARRAKKQESEGVVSLSYGKSTHIPNSERLDNESLDCPVVFVLRSSVAANTMKVFPFDSALYTMGRLDIFAGRGITLESLEIGNSLDAAGRYVHVFYSTNDDYLNDKINLSDKSVSALPRPIEASTLADLIKKRGETERDRRYFTVEIQVPSDVPLNQDTVEHVVLPSFFKEPGYANYVSVIENMWGVRPSFYKACRFDPIVQAALASARANEFIEEQYTDE